MMWRNRKYVLFFKWVIKTQMEVWENLWEEQVTVSTTFSSSPKLPWVRALRFYWSNALEINNIINYYYYKPCKWNQSTDCTSKQYNPVILKWESLNQGMYSNTHHMNSKSDIIKLGWLCKILKGISERDKNSLLEAWKYSFIFPVQFQKVQE